MNVKIKSYLSSKTFLIHSFQICTRTAYNLSINSSDKQSMFLFKIGKQRQKHNLTLKLHKLTYSDSSKLQKGWYFKIKVIRGNQNFDFTTIPIKKGEIKCNKQSHTFPMTLFYDEQTKKYLQKQIEVQGQLMNDLDETERQLGNSVLNITEYMRDAITDKFVLQVQLSDSKNRVCVIKFHVLIERIDDEQKDDIKSVNTNERYQSSNEPSENGENKKATKELTNNYRFGQITPSDTTSQKSVNLRPIKPPKDLKIEEYPKSEREQSVNQKTLSKYNTEKFHSHEEVTENTKAKQPTLQNLASKTPPKPSKQSKETQSSKKPVQQEAQQQEGPQLKLYICQQKLKESQIKLDIAKQKIKDQNQIINKMMQQQDKAQNSTQIIKSMKEIQSLKEQLFKTNLKISELQAQNRQYQSNEKQNLKTIDTKAKQAAYYKQQLEKTKLIFGKLMQRCFQTNDFELMGVIQQELNDIES